MTGTNLRLFGATSLAMLLSCASTEAGDAAAGGERLGCEKIDVVFVIDNSISMFEEHENLGKRLRRIA